jgi:hypothetical protein
MNAPQGDHLDAIKRVAGRPEGQKILEYLLANMALVNARLAHERDPVSLRIMQGEAQTLSVLVKDWTP